MKPHLVRFLLLFSLTGCTTLPRPGAVEARNFRDLSYYLTTFQGAESTERFPLVVVLHGRGDTGEGYLEVWKREAARRRVMVLAPTRTRGYTDDPADLAEFYELVEEIAGRHPVDRERVFLAGTSAGALIARWLAMNRPGFWRGLVLIASPGAESWSARVSGETFPPVLFVHGEKDGQFPVKEIRRHVETLKAKGIEVQSLFDPKEGHTHSPRWNRAIFNWIEEDKTFARPTS